MLRIFCESPEVWRFWIGDNWRSNWFDFSVVLLGIISLDQNLNASGVSLLPLLRLLRLTKLVHRILQMQQILTGLAGGVKSAGKLSLRYNFLSKF